MNYSKISLLASLNNFGSSANGPFTQFEPADIPGIQFRRFIGMISKQRKEKGPWLTDYLFYLKRFRCFRLGHSSPKISFQSIRHFETEVVNHGFPKFRDEKEHSKEQPEINHLLSSTPKNGNNKGFTQQIKDYKKKLIVHINVYQSGERQFLKSEALCN